tara:strand:+ start:1114 stop:1296 length:183 start_codon:yes stop_codon:yes gene_type:complete
MENITFIDKIKNMSEELADINNLENLIKWINESKEVLDSFHEFLVSTEEVIDKVVDIIQD